MKRFSFQRIGKVPAESSLAVAGLMSFIPFFFLTLFFVLNERALRTSSGYGVLDLELAWTPGMIEKIFTAWGPSEMKYQVFVHHVDYLYLLCYGLFAALCILLLARRLKGRLQRIGFFFMLIPLLAALFDAVENIFLLSMLNRGEGFRSSSPAIASLCATFKIAFIGATLSFIFIAAFWLLARRYKIRGVYYYLALLVAGIVVVWLLSMWKLYLCFVIGAVYYAIVLLIIWSSISESRQDTRAST